ncbi:MAG TPA: hypothetical protein VNO30_28530 [Kofleriaceae bacterium]|nr:hypothetical protein [Kofleriaceae bacterium]
MTSRLAVFPGTLAFAGALALTLALGACSRDSIAVSRSADEADYNHGGLRAAVDAYAKAQRTPDAYAELARTVHALRPGMDRAVAEEAELKLVVLALAPVQALAASPMPEQVEALALTVWPTLLAPQIEADAIAVKHDTAPSELYPKQGEKTQDYLRRLCGGPLAGDCKQVVPEYQGHVIAALATRRATERVRNAVAGCVMCSAEPGWHEAMRAWESLDRMATGWIHEIQTKAAPGNWPIAGSSSDAHPGLPEAEVTATGEIVIGGQRYGAATRIDALRELRFLHGDDGGIALHLRPELTLAQVRAILSDTKKSGAKRTAVVARAAQYPWERRIYWVAEGAGVDTELRSTDSLQLLLHTMDHVAGPGAVARID